MSSKSGKSSVISKVAAVTGILVAAGVAKVCVEKIKEKAEHNERVRKEKAINSKDYRDYFSDSGNSEDDEDELYGDENDLYDEDEEDDDDDGIYFSKVVSGPWVSASQKIRDEAENAVTAYTTFGKHFFDEYKNCEVIALGASALTEAKSRYSAEEWRDLRYALKEIACEEYEDELKEEEKEENGESADKARESGDAVKVAADRTLSELRRVASDSLSSLVSGSSVYSTLQNIFGDGDRAVEFEFEEEDDEDDTECDEAADDIDELDGLDPAATFIDECLSDGFLDDLAAGIEDIPDEVDESESV